MSLHTQIMNQTAFIVIVNPTIVMQLQFIHIQSISIHIFVYKTLTKRNEIAWKSRNYDKEMKMQIMNRQYASLYLSLIHI